MLDVLSHGAVIERNSRWSKLSEHLVDLAARPIHADWVGPAGAVDHPPGAVQVDLRGERAVAPMRVPPMPAVCLVGRGRNEVTACARS